jgi:hypothetical protein
MMALVLFVGALPLRERTSLLAPEDVAFDGCPHRSLATGCAEHWEVAHSESLLETILVMNIKGTEPDTLTQFVDYHLVLGAEHLVIIDTNCDPAYIQLTAETLRSYVAQGLVTHDQAFLCFEFNSTFQAPQLRYVALASSAIASRLQRY